MRKVGLSVIVCTYNREKYIQKCINSVLSSFADCDFEYELIVVNNNSTDKTEELLEKYKYIAGVNIIKEMNQGLSHSRNTGLINSIYSYCAFIDDDAFVDICWAKNIFHALNGNENIGIVGGRIMPYFEKEIPSWFSSKFNPLYSILDFSVESNEFPRGTGPVGANMAINMNFLKNIKLFNVNLGRIGKNLLSGEEVEFIRQFKESGALISYISSAAVSHVIPSERLNKNWALNRFFWNGKSEFLSYPQVYKKIALFIIYIYRILKSLIKFDSFYSLCLIFSLFGYVTAFTEIIFKKIK